MILRGVLGGLQGIAVGGGYVYFMGTIGVGSYSSLYVARVPITAQASGADAGATRRRRRGASTHMYFTPDGTQVLSGPL